MLRFFAFICCFFLISCGASDFQKAVNYQKDTEYDKALEFYNKSISKKQNVAESQKNKGDILFIKKDYEKAFECYKKSIELNPDSMDYIFKLLSDMEQDVRTATKNMLIKIENPQAKEKILAKLSEMLKSDKPFEKIDALDLISSFGNEVKPITNDIVALINDDNITVKQKLLAILPDIADCVLPTGIMDKLFELLKSSNDIILAATVECIGNMKQISAYLPQLIDFAKAKPELRQIVADAVIKTNVPSRQEAEKIRKYMFDEDPQIRFLPLLVFKVMGNSADFAIPDFIILSEDKNEKVSQMAKELLENIITENSAIVPDLIKLLNNKDKKIKAEAIRWLANIGPNAKDAIVPLKKVVAESDDKEIRSSANLALKQIEK